MRTAIVCAVLLLAVPGAATAATVQQVSRVVAGYDADVQCLPDDQWLPLLEAQDFSWASTGMVGLTWIGQHKTRFPQRVCDVLERGTKDGKLGIALMAVAHEAAHLRGIADERVAACWGLLWVADLAQRFYDVQFFTEQSVGMVAGAQQWRNRLPANYQGSCA